MDDAQILVGLPTSDPARSRCGYRLRQSCANCEHVMRDGRRCVKHGFGVNMDRGICDDFTLVGRRRINTSVNRIAGKLA